MGARVSAPVQTGSGAYPASCTMGTGSFTGVNRPRRGVNHPPPSSVEVKERVELYLYSPSGPSWPVLGELYLYLTFYVWRSYNYSDVNSVYLIFPKRISGDLGLLH